MCRLIACFAGMVIRLICIGKTDESWLQDAIDKYEKRLKHYIRFVWQVIPDLKPAARLTVSEQKEKEGALILKQLDSSDVVVLLDERGDEFRSVEFARFLEKKMLASTQQLVFVIGGPYGFSAAVYQRSNRRMSLSKLTFSHQMIRLFFTEQLYRAFTILRGEPYHHE